MVFWFIKNVLIGLPDINTVNDMVFNEATVIQDRNGEVLYRLFEENRQYVAYTWISQYMINAIVALEDQRYREHNGLDAMGMLRAAVKALISPNSRVQWASTIPQQLVRNLLLTKDRKVTRKLKEIILTKKLSGVLEKTIRKEDKGLSSAELRKEMKIRTLELYLNYISFGNNAYGIEAASQTYFGKSATWLTVLESSILASIPKWPSLYNPYKNRAGVVGEFVIQDKYGNPVLFSGEVQTSVMTKFTELLRQANLSNKKSNNAVVKFIDGMWSFSLTVAGTSLDVKYKNGRKDLALNRMYEDGYITEQELKDAIIQGITYEFKKNIYPITAPHFVQWVIEQLEQTYGSGTLTKWWFVVKTTLDAKIQKVAEESILANNAVLQDNGANNSSMIYLDTKNGDVLAYVWSIDYFNEAIQWQNDMVRRPRQTWSAIKPLIYALALEKLPLTLDTPIFDIPFSIWWDQPNNADDKFEGMLPLKKALGHSRNIPSAKVITALGWESVVKPFLHKLWLSGVLDSVEYGYTLALWAAEVTMLDFANAYAHLTTPSPAVINPILEVRARDGSLLYQKTWENLQPEVMKPGIISLMRKILSDTANRIPGWENKFTVSGLKYALKTWTSNAKTDRGNRARDGWLAAYTPNKVMVFWWGNADGTPMNKNAFGGTIHANPVKKIFTWLVQNNYIVNENIPDVDLTSVSISKISGKAAWPNTPADLTVSTLKYKNSPGLAADEWVSVISYDPTCNGAVGPFTLPENIKQWYLISPTTFMSNGMDLGEITQWWKESTASVSWVALSMVAPFASGKVTYTFNNIFVQAPTQLCGGGEEKLDTTIKVTMNTPAANATIGSSFAVTYSVVASKNIRRVLVLLDKQQVGVFTYPQGDTKTVTDTKQITLSSTWFKNGVHTLELVAFDFAWFSNKVAVQVSVALWETTPPPAPDTAAPTIDLARVSVSKNADGTYSVLIPLKDMTAVVTGKVTRNGTQLYEFKHSVSTADFQVAELGAVVVTAADPAGNQLNQTLDLTKYLK